MKKLGLAAAAFVLAAALAGCGQKYQTAPEGTQDPPPVTEPNVSPGAGQNQEETNEPNWITLQVEVYFTDDDLMELKKFEREIKVIDEKDKYAEAFKQLQTPEDGMISLWGKVIVNTISFSEGTLDIDIQLPDEARLGSGGESLAIESLKATMFQFDEVQQIELTVDGKQLDSLMGHVDLEHPMTR
ncbi:GerMN domain-containing protein [Paenibacillus fonticola]|uniref:GerMN domain-containing protein n=1 Tax=Paenibacillus fonticola TaxID=379896 RepID=UPI00035F3906|nr:GerMN domain-containing protein [Paenibacillus fonticola]